MDTLTRAPSGAQWTIEAADQRAVVVEVGGGSREYAAAGTDVLYGYGQDEMCFGSAGKVLAPWPNRIRDGQYSFGGEVHQLPLTEPTRHNAIHGLVSWVRWRRVDGGADSVSLEYELAPQPGYRWPLMLRTTWSVGPDGLAAEHSATNLGRLPAPFGLATHPYLAVPGASVDGVRLHVPAHNRLLLDGRKLPIGATRLTADEFDFSQARTIGRAELDTAFGEIERDPHGNSTVTLSDADGRGAQIWADGQFGWWQVFTGDTLAPARRRKAVAVEPMTCPPDAFRSGRDVVVIEPGETWRGTWGIRPLR